jgi:hypothetical protein
MGLMTTTIVASSDFKNVVPSVSPGTSLLSKVDSSGHLGSLYRAREIMGWTETPSGRVAGTEAHYGVQKEYYSVLSLPLRSLAENRGPDPYNVAACFDSRFKVCTHSHTKQ